jgi:hypothetical protein
VNAEEILDLKKQLAASPSLTNEQFRTIMSYQNDEENIDGLNFGRKSYDILDHIVINPI